LRILGDTRTPFAVKGGGHSTNPGFSSTPGVQIAMTRFNTVAVDKTSNTVAIGAGLLWDDVYKALDGTGLNVVGGRVRGVGVAGFTLGGGVWSFSPHPTVFLVAYRRVW
jgi:FAD/FMN-containing dehydrogenase